MDHAVSVIKARSKSAFFAQQKRPDNNLLKSEGVDPGTYNPDKGFGANVKPATIGQRRDIKT